MRWLLLVATLALSGCLQSETSFESDHDHCWIFCGGSDTHVHFDFTPILVLLLVLGLLVGVIIAAAAAGGRDQQQQQVVVYVDPQDPRRR